MNQPTQFENMNATPQSFACFVETSALKGAPVKSACRRFEGVHASPHLNALFMQAPGRSIE